MKTARKAIMLVLCVVLLVVASVMGTLAYLTDTETVENTFTVGKVDIKLDESNVATTDPADRTEESNQYHLLPGQTYVKDPMVTVLKDSEESYVRMLVTLNFSSQLDAIFGPDGADMLAIFNGYDDTKWELADVTKDTTANTRTYEFRYIGTDHQGSKAGTVEKANAEYALDALFDSITVPEDLTNEQLATLVVKDDDGNITSQFTITVVAHAIQADGFGTAADAWTKW